MSAVSFLANVGLALGAAAFSIATLALVTGIGRPSGGFRWVDERQ